MSAITKIEVETWTRDETNASTDDRIDCVITFMDNRSFQQQLDNPGINDFEQGIRDRFNLDLTTASAIAAIAGQQHTDIKSITIKKINGTNTWKCGAVCIRVNDVALFSRYVTQDLSAAGSSFIVTLRKNGVLDGLEVKITTGSWGDTAPSTDDIVYFGLIFSNGLNEIVDLHLFSVQNDFEAGSTYSYLIPLPGDPGFSQTANTVDEFRIRKIGSDGWFLKSAIIYGDGNPSPIISNANINQFLDNDPEVLSIVDWSSKGTRNNNSVPFTVVIPVLGYVSDVSATVQYRVEREGTYRVKVFNHNSGALVQTIDKQLSPTGVFVINSLTSNTQYDISFFFILNGIEIPLTSGDTSFRTSPQEGQGVRFSFGIGSCCRNKNNPAQTVWSQVKNISLDPSIDIVALQPENDLRFFIHSGDTFYFYDDVTHVGVKNLPTNEVLPVVRAAHLTARLNSNFLDMAKRVPTCAVWDDHDFSFNDHDSSNFTNKSLAKQAFLEYWANPTPFSTSYGLTCRMSYGNVDIYLMDGRYNRLVSQGQMFSTAQCNFVIQDIEARGVDRLRILVSGSTWKHTSSPTSSHYGYSAYDIEREAFYSNLNSLIAQGKTKGVVLISGDIHINEIYEVALAPNGNVAPEFVCSPLGNNDDSTFNGARSITGERKWSITNVRQSPPTDSNWGFASIRVDTRGPGPWTIEVKYRNFASGDPPYYTKSYTLFNNQFKF